jgi:hypothetical protein
LRVRAAILILFTFVIAPACDRSATAWPPHQAQLAHVFDRHKATFILIEQEMAADGLLRMAPALFSETARNPGIPKLPSNQVSKYVALFDSTQMYLYVTRLEQSTSFEMLIQNVGPRLYLSRFIHTAIDNSLRNCAPAMQHMACGSCSIPLEPEWLLEYDWFPANPEAEAREC